jgi:membrane-associated phospholipid phosphatase
MSSGRTKGIRSRLGLVALLASVMVLGLVRDAHAGEPSASASDDEHELRWRGTPYHPLEAVGTALAGGAALAVVFGTKPAAEPRLAGGILFDDAVRDGLRLRSPGARDAARAVSDVTAVASLVVVLGVDSLAVPLLRGSPGVALRMLAVDLEAVAWNGLLTPSVYTLTARARPSREDCLRDPGFDPLCNAGTSASFWSGHTAQAFNAAGLSCAHHAYLHLLGGGAPDAVACAGMVTLAATTGTLRVMGDRHHATDVIVGSLVGFGIGYGVPTLLHYFPYGYARRAHAAGLTIRPYATLGLSLDAAF